VATSDEQLKYQIALTLLPGIGSVIARNLVSYCGSVEAVFKAKKQQLEKIPGIGKAIAAKIRELVETGSLNYFEELRSEFPAEILELFSLPGEEVADPSLDRPRRAGPRVTSRFGERGFT